MICHENTYHKKTNYNYIRKVDFKTVSFIRDKGMFHDDKRISSLSKYVSPQRVCASNALHCTEQTLTEIENRQVYRHRLISTPFPEELIEEVKTVKDMEDVNNTDNQLYSADLPNAVSTD